MRDRFGRNLTILAVLLVGVVAAAIWSTGSDDGDGPASTGPSPSRSETGSDVRPNGSVEDVEVNRVIDGDTIEVDLDGREEDVRYIGIDTPESVKPGSPVECFGPESAEYNRVLVGKRPVDLDFGPELRDRYGRLLAYVHVGEVFVNAQMVVSGYALPLEIPPNDRYASRFKHLAEVAAQNGRGLWAGCP